MMLTPGQPVVTLFNRVATGVPVFKSLVSLHPEKAAEEKRDPNPRLTLSKWTPYRQANEAMNDIVWEMLASISVFCVFICLFVCFVLFVWVFLFFVCLFVCFCLVFFK